MLKEEHTTSLEGFAPIPDFHFPCYLGHSSFLGLVVHDLFDLIIHASSLEFLLLSRFRNLPSSHEVGVLLTTIAVIIFDSGNVIARQAETPEVIPAKAGITTQHG